MPTIKDVAKALNISITTVSRALDGYDDVAKDTRELVIKTAREMGYSPNRAARQLRRQKSETVGYILPASAHSFDEPFFTEFISGLGEALSNQNFDLLVANANSDEQERNLYQRWINGHKVDGFILNRIRARDWRVQMLAEARVPFTALGKSQDGVDYPCLRIDGLQGYTELVSYLHNAGFQRFAFIGGLEDLINHIDRLDWFKAALGQQDMPVEPDYIIASDMSSSGGYAAAQTLLGGGSPPDVILCINDETAFGALHAAHEHGLEIGKEIAIAGFEGVQDAVHSVPPLTTLDIPVQDIARQLVEMLLSTISGDMMYATETKIRPTLLKRASTGGD